MKTNAKLLVFSAAAALAFSSCKKDNVEPEHDHEAVAVIELHFTEEGNASNHFVVSWTDLDGEGGMAPVIEEIELEENKVYNVEIEMLSADGDDLTHDITDHEADAHRFYYEPSAGTGITVSNLDKDPNGVTLGVSSAWTTGEHGEGTMKITLRHYGNEGKAESDLVNSGKSSTDAELVFDVHVH